MRSAHTAGPWWVAPRANNFIDVCHKQNAIPGSITLALCRVQARQTWIAEAEANARLIAAAPTMFEALKALVVLINELDGIEYFPAGSLQAIALPAIALAEAK